MDIGNGKVEEMISYNQPLEHLETAQDNDMGIDQEWFKFRAIIGLQGPLVASDSDWKDSQYSVEVEWETGEMTFEPSRFLLLIADSPVQHMPKNMIYLLWKASVGSGTLPSKIKSLQGQSNKVSSGKSGDPKPTCLAT